jgi:putative endonuclease
MFTVYIIYSTHLNRYYVGYSEDVQKRLAEHNSGISDFTSKTNDWQLKYTEIFDNRKQAISREREIKNKKSRKYVEWLIAKSG